MMDELFFCWWEYTVCCLYIPFLNFAAWILRWPLIVTWSPILCCAMPIFVVVQDEYNIFKYWCFDEDDDIKIAGMYSSSYYRRWYKSAKFKIRCWDWYSFVVVIFCGVLWTTKVRWSVRGCDLRRAISQRIDVFRCNDCWEFSMLLYFSVFLRRFALNI